MGSTSRDKFPRETKTRYHQTPVSISNLVGARVKASLTFFKKQYINGDIKDVYIATCKAENMLIGHVFMNIQLYLGSESPKFLFLTLAIVAWISQLVVHQDYRSKGIATTLISTLLKEYKIEYVGIASAHPHAILAVKRASGSKFELENEWIIPMLITVLQVNYLKAKKFVGIFEPRHEGNQCQLINSEFWIDQTSAIEALGNIREDWPLGMLRPGHEFVAAFCMNYKDEIAIEKNESEEKKQRKEEVGSSDWDLTYGSLSKSESEEEGETRAYEGGEEETKFE